MGEVWDISNESGQDDAPHSKVWFTLGIRRDTIAAASSDLHVSLFERTAAFEYNISPAIPLFNSLHLDFFVLRFLLPVFGEFLIPALSQRWANCIPPFL